MKRLFYLLLLTSSLFACQTDSPAADTETDDPADQLGNITFTVSGNAEAQPLFKKGLLLLHSFEYEDAREAFQEAREADPQMAMAYWGEAMTHHHTLWRHQDSTEAMQILSELAPTRAERLAKAQTELEKDILQSAEILFGEGQKYERDEAYATYLAELHKKYPNNHEVAALYAISLLGSVPVGRDDAVYEKGARIAQGILAENPEHPGALHYLIHSYDDPAHAPLALQAANRYSQVAPDAAHALHMPSHIYVAMGMWDEVIDANIASWEASLKRMKRKGLEEDGDAKSYHALHWLMYGHLQKGEEEEAKKLLQDMVEYVDEHPTKRARAYLIAMKANYLADRAEWDAEMEDIAIEIADLNISVQAAYHFMEGREAFLQKQQDTLEHIINQIQQQRQLAELQISDKGLPMCSASGWVSNQNNRQDIDEAHIMEMQLQAMLAQMTQNDKQAEDWMLKAIALQEQTSYAFGPPNIAIPPYEMYGNWLREQGREKEAEAQFVKAQERGPGRRKAA